MSDPFLGEIRIFTGNFAPRGWAMCDGLLLPINSNQALFALLGTFYGGDGRTNFALPDLRGRVPTHFSTPTRIGTRFGAEGIALSEAEIPAHDHSMTAVTDGGTRDNPAGTLRAASSVRTWTTSPSDASLGTGALADAGGGQAHNNMMPFTVATYIIALQGVFPSRN